MLRGFLLSVTLLALFASHCNSLPLSTHKRWIVDDATGKRVKLTCAHWVAHVRPMVAEGLDKLPLNDIVAQLPAKGFNCVRFSYATYMFTRYANQSVFYSMTDADIPEMIPLVAKHNPKILNMTLLQAFETVVDALGKEGVMVIIDNHVSLPKWCCDNNDQNGFFGDMHFQTKEWLQGLAFVASHFKGKPHVIAVDLRNELRGTRQNTHDWYKYVTQGVTTIHKNNPHVLVIVSGLNFDNDLSFLKNKPLDVNIGNKLVYEAHIYSFSGPPSERWTLQPLNRVCGGTIDALNNSAGFVMSGPNAAPFFISEFGYDMTLGSASDNNFLPCFNAYAATVDLDWSLWAFGGSYYLRQGLVGTQESYAVLDGKWKNYRDPNFPKKFQLLQRIVQDPGSNLPKSHILFHPLSGECGHVNGNNELVMGDCKNESRWSFEGNGTPISLMDSALCVKASGEGHAVTLSKDCLAPQSSWKAVSLSGLHLATFGANGNGERLCLHRDSGSEKIVTKKCICIEDDSACLDNPLNQWFKLVSTNV